MTNPITREKCLELIKCVGLKHFGEGWFYCGTPADPEPELPALESLVRASVCLGMEMAAKECEKERAALEQNREVWNKHPMFEPTEEYIADWESSACRGEEYAASIRKLAEEVQRG